MAPITIRLCEEMDLNPVPILMAIIFHANIGGIIFIYRMYHSSNIPFLGTSTPVGDLSNIIITSNHYILEHV